MPCLYKSDVSVPESTLLTGVFLYNEIDNLLKKGGPLPYIYIKASDTLVVIQEWTTG